MHLVLDDLKTIVYRVTLQVSQHLGENIKSRVKERIEHASLDGKLFLLEHTGRFQQEYWLDYVFGKTEKE